MIKLDILDFGGGDAAGRNLDHNLSSFPRCGLRPSSRRVPEPAYDRVTASICRRQLSR
ncbi:hypothetical protein RHECNPAF_4310014 [Rhizobium etli CNPAF512]|nr:hypothetical protein RHECNPAF_4310014 [Rhizobium etli CNPAF512]